jgi:hypothetical protein
MFLKLHEYKITYPSVAANNTAELVVNSQILKILISEQ